MLQIKFSLYSDAKIRLSLVVLMLWEGKYVSADKKNNLLWPMETRLQRF